MALGRDDRAEALRTQAASLLHDFPLVEIVPELVVELAQEVSREARDS
jgi:hypothetical protein